MSAGIELWRYEEGRESGIYRWMVWGPGLAGRMEPRWFTTEADARHFFDVAVSVVPAATPEETP